jgi:hypothetical protein
MTNFYESIATFLFGLLLSAYLWIRNEMSDKWIVIFFSTILAQQLLESIQSIFIKNITINNIISLISYILFLIHPIINILGSYTQLQNGLSYEPLMFALGFIIYKLLINPVKVSDIYTYYNKGRYISKWLEKFNKYELIVYLFLLLSPMVLYNPPKNVLMIGSTLITLFVAYMLNNRKLENSVSLWYKYLTGILLSNVLFL